MKRKSRKNRENNEKFTKLSKERKFKNRSTFDELLNSTISSETVIH